MGFFESVGRQVEQFKQIAERTAAEEAHQCPACDERFGADHDRCPECGSEDVESVDTGE